MNVELYSVYLGAREEKLKHFSVHMNSGGKTMVYVQEPDPDDELKGFVENYLFSCNYDNTFLGEFEKLKLNYRFNLFSLASEGEYDKEIEAYAQLNLIDRFRLSWVFKKNWFQKSENIKWLILVLVTVFVALITKF